MKWGWVDPAEFNTGYSEIGKSGRQIDAELREVAGETRKRVNNGLDIEDQEARAVNLREARARMN